MIGDFGPSVFDLQSISSGGLETTLIFHDGYNPSSMMTVEEAERYHAVQINTFRESNADMINCAHPTHFEQVLEAGEYWVSRIHGIRANASCMSHAELDEATELDDGNPVELGDQHRQLSYKLHNLNVLGGCCGTDHRHVEEICKAFVPQYAETPQRFGI